jgi:hypothetical protein
LDVYPVIFFVCIIICNLLYVCPIKLIKKKRKKKRIVPKIATIGSLQGRVLVEIVGEVEKI